VLAGAYAVFGISEASALLIELGFLLLLAWGAQEPRHILFVTYPLVVI
jgi:hypothetical protein